MDRRVHSKYIQESPSQHTHTKQKEEFPFISSIKIFNESSQTYITNSKKNDNSRTCKFRERLRFRRGSKQLMMRKSGWPVWKILLIRVQWGHDRPKKKMCYIDTTTVNSVQVRSLVRPLCVKVNVADNEIFVCKAYFIEVPVAADVSSNNKTSVKAKICQSVAGGLQGVDVKNIAFCDWRSRCRSAGHWRCKCQFSKILQHWRGRSKQDSYGDANFSVTWTNRKWKQNGNLKNWKFNLTSCLFFHTLLF